MLSINKKYTPYILALLVVVCFSACQVRKYHRPELPLPASFPTVANNDTASIANLSRKQFFPDTALQTLISKGLQHNYDLLVAMKNIETADQQLRQARALQLPQAVLQVSSQINRPSDNSLSGITANSFLHQSYIGDYNASLTLAWEADVWGKLRMQRHLAFARYLQSEEAVTAIQTRLVADIAQQYYELLMLDEQLNIAHNNLRLSDTLLLLTRLQKDAGNTTLLAVQQAEAQKQATAILIPELEQNVALHEHALSILTGELPGTIQRNRQSLPVNNLISLPTGIPAALLDRRPDVHIAELDLIAANHQVGIAHASMYPSLNITAAGGLNTFTASNWFNIPASLFGIVAGSAVQPLLQHRTLKTRYKVAQIQREQAVLRFRQTVLTAVGEVADALVKEEKTSVQQKMAADRVDTLNKAVRNAQLLFRSNMATYLEVITAQANALQAELDLASYRKQRSSAAIDLYRALGGGRN